MKLFTLLIVLFFSLNAFGGESCPGKVTEIMDHSRLDLCDGHFSFRLSSTGNTYLCSLSNKGDSMVLAAYVSGKTISPRLSPPIPGDCKSFDSNYIKPSYIRIAE